MTWQQKTSLWLIMTPFGNWVNFSAPSSEILRWGCLSPSSEIWGWGVGDELSIAPPLYHEESLISSFGWKKLRLVENVNHPNVWIQDKKIRFKILVCVFLVWFRTDWNWNLISSSPTVNRKLWGNRCNLKWDFLFYIGTKELKKQTKK